MNPGCDTADTDRYIAYLNETKAHIVWAEDASHILQLAKKIQLECESSTSDLLTELKLKLKHLQNYIHIDQLCHLTSPVTRPPFYLHRMKNTLENICHLLPSEVHKNGTATNGSAKEEDLRDAAKICECASELNLMISEFGFVSSGEDENQESENSAKLWNSVKQRLLEVGKKYEERNAYDSANDLREIMKNWGRVYDHVTTSTNVGPEVGEAEEEISRIKGLLLEKYLKSTEPTTVSYLAMFHLLKKDFLSKIFHSDPLSILNSHVIHPSSRGWLLERIRRWIQKPRSLDRRVYYVMAKQGFGRTSIASAVCKIHSTDVAACHFFDSKTKSQTILHNSLLGLIQSISVGLMKTTPEYLNYLDDKISGDKSLLERAGSSWNEAYTILLKDPLQNLYGKTSPEQVNGKSHRRKIIVIDSLEECSTEEWKDLYSFLTQFLKDTSRSFCLFLTVRSKKSSAILPTLEMDWEGVRLDDKAWVGFHISDLEKYMAHSVGTIVSRGSVVEEEKVPSRPGRVGIQRADKTQPAVTGMSPTAANHGRVDQKTLEETVDDFVKMTAGRFDWAVDLVELFSKEMAISGQQFIGSVKRVNAQMKVGHGEGPPLSPGGTRGRGSTSHPPEKTFVERTTEFCGSFRAYRDKSGRSEGVKVTSPRQHIQNTSRLPLLISRLEL